MSAFDMADDDEFPGAPADPAFPHAPLNWSRQDAERLGQAEGLVLTDMHWEEIRGLQEYFARHADALRISLRDIHDALDERFHSRGGIRKLYELFPGGPIAQGCRLAGLKAPFTAMDASFGSVA